MKRLIITMLLIFTASCIEADLKGAADSIADALDGNCSTSALWTLQTKKNDKDDKGDKNDKNDKGDKDDEVMPDDEEEDIEDETVASNTSDCDNNDSTASNDDQDDTDVFSDSGSNSDDSNDIITSAGAAKAGWEFVGTYQQYIDGDSCSNDFGNDYAFPTSVRIFSYSDKLDFLTTGGNLAWTARVFPDESFDFSAKFANSFGQKTITVACTCEVQENQYFYDNGGFQCACEPSNGDDICSIKYNKI